VEQGNAQVDGLLQDRTLVAKADNYGQYAEVELAENGDAQQLLHRLVSTGARVRRFEIAEPTLHKIFVDMVGEDRDEAEAEEVGADA
jgi:ABC-type uncharacterized transport system ATPase subunit